MPIIAPIEGRAFAEFILRVPTSSGQSAAFKFTEGLLVHVRSELIDSVTGDTRYFHRFRTSSPEVIDKVVKSAMAGGRPILLFRLGLGTPDETAWLPYQQHTVVSYSGILEGIGDDTGHFFELRTESPLWDMSRVNKTAARKGTISKIVAEIAEENGIEQTVIEPTSGTGLYFQSYIADTEFIRNRLRARAANSKGRGNYQFFFRDNALHFHTPDYQAELKELQFYNSSANLLSITDHSQKLIDAGISGCQLISYDPLTGQTQEQLTDPQTSVRYADYIYRIDKIKGSQRVVQFHLSPNRSEEVKHLAQSLYESARMGAFEAVFRIPKVIHLRAGDILNLIVNPDSKRTSAWSGVYFVSDVATLVDGGTVEARVTARRGELQKSQMDIIVAGGGSEPMLSGEHEAPGQPLNLKELRASVLTKGRALESAGTKFAVVQPGG